MILTFLSLLLTFLTIVPFVSASYNPLTQPNNQYGIHIVDTNDLTDVAALVNSSGGDWGYVTMVLSDAERDHDRWQNVFNHMRRAHLIPIIRLATHAQGSNWVKPTKDRFYEIVNLLNGLNWPTQNRYIILYNEPNHAKEWGGDIHPEEYAEYLVTFAQELKRASPDYFVLPAGLDASAATDGQSMDAAEFIRRMVAAKPELLTVIDGWTSHAYPNPGFSGSPYARGRGTLTTYEWELSLLSSLGLTKPLPVFITETGWEHSEGKSYAPGLLSSDRVGENLLVAAQSVWSDPQIAAVTPFIFNYQDVPFDHFSWKQIEGDSFYSQYGSYASIPKIHGIPLQHESYILESALFPKTLVAQSTYTLSAKIKNEGQGIIDPKDGYELTVEDGGSGISVFVQPLPVVEPGDTGTITIHLKTPQKTGVFPLKAILVHHNLQITLEHGDITLVPPPSVEVRAALGWRKSSDASDASILVYERDTLLQEFTGLTMKDGVVTARGLTNIVPGNPYRVVILVPGYLPRQVIGALLDKTTTIYPKRFLPLDFSGDGKFSWADILKLVYIAPATALARFFGP